MSKIRDVKIKAVMNGYIVKVDCQTLVFDSLKKLLKALKKYYKDPEKTEARFAKEAINARYTLGPALGGQFVHLEIRNPEDAIGWATVDLAENAEQQAPDKG